MSMDTASLWIPMRATAIKQGWRRITRLWLHWEFTSYEKVSAGGFSTLVARKALRCC